MTPHGAIRLFLGSWLALLLTGLVAQATAADLSGVLSRVSGSQITVLITGPRAPSGGARVYVARDNIFGEALSGASGEVTARKGAVLTIAAGGGGLDRGPVSVSLLSGDLVDTAGGGIEGAVGTSAGSLEPNFTLPGRDTGATGDGEEAGTGGPDDIDTTINNPDLLALVREWIGIAEPPENAKPGYHLQYSKWGQVFGTTPTGTITVNFEPDDAAGMPYDVFLWTRRTDLASLRHCTLRQFVLTRLRGATIDGCTGSGVATTVAAPVPVTEGGDDTTRSPIPGNADISGRISPKGDRDEFVFSASHHGEWTITVARAPAGVEIGLGVFPAPNGNWLPDMSPKEPGTLTVDLPAPGDYILRATGTNGGMRSVSPYRLALNFTPSPDRFEPNNSAVDKDPIDGTRTLLGTILPRGDRDEFLFHAPHHGQWTITVAEAPEGVAVGLGVFPAPNGNWLPDMSPK
ncbi:MAG: hypothetical protein ACE5FS_16070, partial [Paracoccaceae bacterium]